MLSNFELIIFYFFQLTKLMIWIFMKKGFFKNCGSPGEADVGWTRNVG